MKSTWIRAGISLAVLLSSGLALGACASAGIARPSPFPTAPVPSPPALLTPPAPPESERPDVASLVTTALSFRGVPYRAGGEDPQLGFDCSGYVQYVFGLFHVDLPRTVAEQFRIGTKESLNKIRAGDLLFFSTVAPGATHVAIALGNAKFVHAPSSTGTVRVEALASSYWSARFVGARRVVAAK